MSATAFAGNGHGNLLAGVPPEMVVFGSTDRMQSLQRKLRVVAQANVPVLITGENGTGKEILARLIHHQSPWSEGPFVKVNCPAIPGTLLESELFGYERGAFTGAYGAKPGRVELAHRGSLFLDEIGEMDLGIQAKLLQLLQDGQFCRIGAQEDKKVEVRVICATNRDLQGEIAAGRFRQDLFYRINVVQIQVPPLRHRAQDIPALTNYFLQLYAQKFSVRPKPVPSSLMEMLQNYSWPGNIRQLENLVKRYVILGNEEAVTSELISRGGDCFDPIIPSDGKISLKKATRDAVRELERRIIIKVLHANNWNRKRAAKALSISYRALLYKIQEAGIGSSRIRAIEPMQPMDEPEAVIN
ncbi:MAG TPA: sigma-54 dependent transcriptional regulator [Terriglobales bacterium]|nr:sigma-54 dependent transcriptional regulator [Terriglobales bacterium]